MFCDLNISRHDNGGSPEGNFRFGNPDFLLRGRTSASAECSYWSGRVVRWFDFAQRAALHAVAPHLQASEQQNLELQNRLAREARARLDAAVERAVPNYREIDQEPRWHNWLFDTSQIKQYEHHRRGYAGRAGMCGRKLISSGCRSVNPATSTAAAGLTCAAP